MSEKTPVRCYYCGRTPARGHDEDCCVQYEEGDPFQPGIAKPEDEVIDELQAQVEKLTAALRAAFQRTKNGKDLCHSAYCHGWDCEDECSCWVSDARELLGQTKGGE